MAGRILALLVTHFPKGERRGGAAYTSDPYGVPSRGRVVLEVVSAVGAVITGVSAQLQGSRDRTRWSDLGFALAPAFGSLAVATEDHPPPLVRVVVTVAGADDLVMLSVKTVGGETEALPTRTIVANRPAESDSRPAREYGGVVSSNRLADARDARAHRAGRSDAEPPAFR